MVMKLLTLLTTLIITLASSNVFAQKFLCENWREYKGKDVYENKGSLFVGEKIDDTITIEDQYGKKLTTGSLVALAEASKFGESMVYLKNLSSDDNVRGSAPKIVVAFATNEEITIGTGEFALIPWDGGTDLKIKHNGTGSAPYCEFAIFEF